MKSLFIVAVLFVASAMGANTKGCPKPKAPQGMSFYDFSYFEIVAGFTEIARTDSDKPLSAIFEKPLPHYSPYEKQPVSFTITNSDGTESVIWVPSGNYWGAVVVSCTKTKSGSVELDAWFAYKEPTTEIPDYYQEDAKKITGKELKLVK